MGLRFRKSKNFGPFRINFSKSGIGYSVGGKGFRVTKTADGRVRQTASIPGTGISYVTETKRRGSVRTPQQSIALTEKQKRNLRVNSIIIRIFFLLLVIIVAATAWAIYYNTTVQTDYTPEELLFLDGHPRIYDTVQKADEFYGQFEESRIRVSDYAWIAERQSGLKSYADDKVIMYLVESGEYIDGAIFNLKESDFGRPLDISSVYSVIGTYLPANLCSAYKTDAMYTFSTEKTMQYVYCGRINKESALPYYESYFSIIATNFLREGFWRVEVKQEAYGGRSLEWIEKNTTPWDFDLSQYIK